MNKLDIAHDYALKLPAALTHDELKTIVSLSWQYADLMQAEADKREQEEAKKSAELSKQFFDSLTKKPNGECAHFHTTLNRTECFDCGEVLKQDDWQPNWSVAPENMIYFAVDSNNDGYFYEYKPYISEGYDYWGDVENKHEGLSAKEYNDHAYQGDWRKSLRKRPQ